MKGLYVTEASGKSISKELGRLIHLLRIIEKFIGLAGDGKLGQSFKSCLEVLGNGFIFNSKMVRILLLILI